MAITTGPRAQEEKVRIRFLRGVCYEGVDYGPRHRDAPVSVPAYKARQYIGRGVARLEDTPKAKR